MSLSRIGHLRQTAVMLAAFLLVMFSARAAEKVGLIVAVRGKATAQIPGGEKRALELKSPVYKNDVLKTKSKAKLQVMFLDHTTITVGQKAKLTIDEFVYKAGDKNSVCVTSSHQCSHLGAMRIK